MHAPHDFRVHQGLARETAFPFFKYILEMIALRKEAKANKNFEEADRIRNELLEKKVVLKDSREGTTYEVIK